MNKQSVKSSTPEHFVFRGVVILSCRGAGEGNVVVPGIKKGAAEAAP